MGCRGRRIGTRSPSPWVLARRPPRPADRSPESCEPSRPVAVIDWEYCRVGDPAYDLAIVTRGARRPFQMADGLDRLLGDYREAGGAPVTRADIHVHELCLIGGYYRDSLRGEHPHRPPEVYNQLRGLLGNPLRCT